MATWSIPFEKLAKKHDLDVLGVIQESLVFVFARIIILSPVDTGRFRANWNPFIGSIDYTTRADEDKSGQLSMNRAEDWALRLKLGQTIYFTNSLPYAMRLEYGWSQQAPNGMVRTAVRDFAASVERAIKKRNR